MQERNVADEGAAQAPSKATATATAAASESQHRAHREAFPEEQCGNSVARKAISMQCTQQTAWVDTWHRSSSGSSCSWRFVSRY